MTLGRKIRYARRHSGLSQEQLAQKLCVSRSAIAKWETDKGMPDVENLKQLAKLLSASLDSLLYDDPDAAAPLLRIPCNLAAYGRGCDKVKKGRLLQEQFPGARITPLLARPELTDPQAGADSALGFLTPIPFGGAEYLKSMKDLPRDFYLIDQDGEQLFVSVSQCCIEVCPLHQPIREKTFHLAGWVFIRSDHPQG